MDSLSLLLLLPEPGCNRGTKSPNEMPRNSHAPCLQQLFALSGGDESFACKYFLIHPILNLKLALDHSVLEKYPQLIRAISEELFASPRKIWACQQPRFMPWHTFLPQPWAGVSPPPQLGLSPVLRIPDSFCKEHPAFPAQEKSPYSHKAKQTHIDFILPSIFNQYCR